ncbi:tyrosine-protein kinase BTK-like [Hydractinia symbiolongicarpus]|nr:tyrosine-protein kinase BTK-like [Hydractinia symbiolongicarpus]
MLKQEILGSGVFGTVKEGFIPSIQQKVAVKIFSEKLGRTEMLAECAISLEMSGHPNFAFVFGMCEPNRLILEFIGNDVTAPTLGDTISNSVKLPYWKPICIDLIHALHDLHNKGILHNDLHSRNILLRNLKHVKIIDFGKATLVEDPVRYSIKPGTPKHQRYNTIHRHLAFELRNVPGSYVSCETDVYTLGYNFESIAKHVASEKLLMIATNMLKNKPHERPLLSQLLIQLSRL